MTSSVSLASLKTGKTAVVEAFAGGREARGRLLSFGLLPGEVVEVVTNDGHGPVIVRLGGRGEGSGRIALGRGLASKVFVREAASSCEKS